MIKVSQVKIEMMDYYSQFNVTDQAIKEARSVGIEPICKYVIREVSYTSWCIYGKGMMKDIDRLQKQWEKTILTILLRKITKEPTFIW
jgi:nitric oxide reductase activation protein